MGTCPGSPAKGARGQPYRGGTGCRGPFRRSPRPAASSAGERWGCARGRAGLRHGARLGAARLRVKKSAEVRGARRPRPPPRLRHLPAAGPRRPRGRRRGRRAARSSVAMAAGTREQGPAEAANLSRREALLKGLWKRRLVARPGKGPVAKYQKKTQAACPLPIFTGTKLSPFLPATRKLTQASPVCLELAPDPTSLPTARFPRGQ